MNREFRSALTSIIRSFPPGIASRPNTLVTISDFSDLDTENLGATITASMNDLFWSRSMEASGNNPREIEAEYSIVYLRHTSSVFSENGTGSISYDIEVGLVSLPECEGCELARTPTQIRFDNAVILRRILAEVTNMTYQSGQMSGLDGVYLLSPSMASGLQLLGVWTSMPGRLVGVDRGCSPGKIQDISSLSTEIRHLNYGTKNAIVSYSTIRIQMCPERVSLDFSAAEYESYAETKCETCQ